MREKKRVANGSDGVNCWLQIILKAYFIEEETHGF